MKMKWIITILLSFFAYATLQAQTDSSCSVEVIQNGKKVNVMPTEKDGIPVITLEQTPGEFVQQSIKLKPGKYRFKVSNLSVDHEVGLYLRAAKTKKSVPNSGTDGHIKKGESKETGVVELKEGEYLYSCPLNPTGDCKITVSSN
ncbi:MAG: hypothetical protein SFU91_01555 [Chloroherpetonaceae bacterium]|nr:hypothetical protein [Chloroherpetonaceae bacterium]